MRPVHFQMNGMNDKKIGSVLYLENRPCFICGKMPSVLQIFAPCEQRHQFGFCYDFAIDCGFAAALAHIAASLPDFDFELQLIAGHDLLSETRFVDAHEQGNQIALLPIAHQNRRGLREGFDDEHARHHGIAREMPLEERLIRRHIFVRDQPLAGDQLGHAIHQQKGIAVRKDFLDVLSVQNHGMLQWKTALPAGRDGFI